MTRSDRGLTSTSMSGSGLVHLPIRVNAARCGALDHEPALRRGMDTSDCGQGFQIKTDKERTERSEPADFTTIEIQLPVVDPSAWGAMQAPPPYCFGVGHGDQRGSVRNVVAPSVIANDSGWWRSQVRQPIQKVRR